MKNYMKKITYLYILGIAIMILSCKDQNQVFKELTWKETTSLSATPDSLRNFVVGIDDAGMPAEMLRDEVTIQFKLDWDGENPVSKVTLYVQLEENIDGVKKTYGADSEIELDVISEFDEEGRLDYVLKSDEVYALLSPAFNGSRDQYAVPALPGDIIEITWKITGHDGSIIDVRNECFGAGCQYSLSVEAGSAIFNWFNGTFDYVWTVASQDVIDWGNYYGGDPIDVGTTGTIEYTATAKAGESTIPNTVFYYWYHPDMDYDYYPSYPTGIVNHDEKTGVLELIDEAEYGITWEVSNIIGTSLDISWKISSSEYGTVTLTRKDGKDWPTNINTPLGEATEEEVWNGTYTFEYLEVGPGVAAYSYYDEIFVGYTSTVDCATIGGIPSVSHGSFDYWYEAPWEVTLSYDYATGVVAIADSPTGVITWEISNVTARTIDIFYDFHSGYEEYSTVRLTRTGNYDWPSNLHTE